MPPFLLRRIQCHNFVSLFQYFFNPCSHNICANNVAKFRKELRYSQRQLADVLQLAGLDIDKNAIQRIEAGKRFVTDIELTFLSKVLRVSLDDLLVSK